MNIDTMYAKLYAAYVLSTETQGIQERFYYYGLLDMYILATGIDKLSITNGLDSDYRLSEIEFR